MSLSAEVRALILAQLLGPTIAKHGRVGAQEWATARELVARIEDAAIFDYERPTATDTPSARAALEPYAPPASPPRGDSISLTAPQHTPRVWDHQPHAAPPDTSGMPSLSPIARPAEVDIPPIGHTPPPRPGE